MNNANLCRYQIIIDPRNAISFSFLGLMIRLNELDRSSWYSDPPFSNPPYPSITTLFPIWHLPCVKLNEYHQQYVFWRNKGKHCC